MISCCIFFLLDILQPGEKMTLTVQYDKGDETEMLFRVLSFGPTVKVRDPEAFKELIRKSSENSCNAAQNFKCACFFHDYSLLLC